LVTSDSTICIISWLPSIDAGVPVPIVAARLAHARASTTLNVYPHAVPGGYRLAAEALWRKVHEAARESAG
jgi:integrase